MKMYSMTFQYSKDGKNWTGSSANIKADSDMSAIAQVQNRYPYVRNIRIVSSR